MKIHLNIYNNTIFNIDIATKNLHNKEGKKSLFIIPVHGQTSELEVWNNNLLFLVEEKKEEKKIDVNQI